MKTSVFAIVFVILVVTPSVKAAESTSADSAHETREMTAVEALNNWWEKLELSEHNKESQAKIDAIKACLASMHHLRTEVKVRTLKRLQPEYAHEIESRGALLAWWAAITRGDREKSQNKAAGETIRGCFRTINTFITFREEAVIQPVSASLSQ